MAKRTQVEEKSPKPRRISRTAAANEVVAQVTGTTTLAELAQAADDVFVAGGGESNLKVASWNVRRSLGTAESLGAVRLTRPTDVLVEKVEH